MINQYERVQHRILISNLESLKNPKNVQELLHAGLKIKKALAKLEVIGSLHRFNKLVASIDNSNSDEERKKSLISDFYQENLISPQEINSLITDKNYASDVEIMKIAIKAQNLMRLGLHSFNKLEGPWTKESVFHSTNSLLGSSIFHTSRALNKAKEGRKTSDNIVLKFLETTNMGVPPNLFEKLVPVEVIRMKCISLLTLFCNNMYMKTDAYILLRKAIYLHSSSIFSTGGRRRGGRRRGIRF